MNYSEVQDVNSKSAPKSKATLRSISVERAANGGFMVEHRFNSNNGPYRDPETHTFGKDEGKKVLAHMSKHMGITGDEDGDREKGEKDHQVRAGLSKSAAGAAQ